MKGEPVHESGTVIKDPGGKLNIALVYPNTYWIGMSNLGMQAMYRRFNEHPGILCERFFTDHPRSVETSRPLQDFHIIAFSLSYELDFIECIRILDTNSIALRSGDRGGRPIVMAGGPAITSNPEPMADVFDICFLGDGETLPDQIHQAFQESPDCEGFLDRMMTVPGVYIPARTRPVTESGSITGFEGPRPGLSLLAEMQEPACTSIVTQDTAFGDMFLVEVARGCPFSCRFCSAREIYSPYRPVPLERLLPAFDEATRHRKKIGLVSTSLNNHPDASALFRETAARGLHMAPPSLRPGMIGRDLMEALASSEVKGITLAPETGSEDLRFSVGKRIKNETILEDVRALVDGGIRDIKLYFMVGLPGENTGHIDEMIDLIKRVRQTFILVSRGNRKIGSVGISINTFVPKPHTPFERQAMADIGDAKTRLAKIGKALRKESNVSVSYEGPKWAYIQSLFARGDRKVLDLVIAMAKTDSRSWQRLLRDWPRNPDYYALRERPENEILPWSFYSTSCSPGISEP
jgi:radical SAM superfamily enzyme YgiQ (UPF0313 family)